MTLYSILSHFHHTTRLKAARLGGSWVKGMEVQGFRPGVSRAGPAQAVGAQGSVPSGFGVFGSIVNPKKLETGLRINSAGTPYTLLLRIEAIGFPTFGLLL